MFGSRFRINLDIYPKAIHSKGTYHITMKPEYIIRFCPHGNLEEKAPLDGKEGAWVLSIAVIEQWRRSWLCRSLISDLRWVGRVK